MIGRLQNWLGKGRLFLLLELALVAALAAVLAHWTWIVLTPPTVAATTLSVGSEPRSAFPPVRPQMFGAGAGAVGDAASSARLKLVGLFSPDAGKSGRAIFLLENGKSRSARVGDTVVAGFVLQEVHPDHVLLGHSDGVERLKLDRRARPQP